MTIGRLLAWCVVVFTATMPFNWARLWIVGDVPSGGSFSGFLTGTLICWGITGGLICFLIGSARGRKRMQAAAAKAVQEIVNQPLTEIRPTQVLLKAGEKAYASVRASLHELKTLGFKAGTRGISVRVAKGVTLRTSGSRGRAVKGSIRIASGELVVSDKRVIFAGDHKSFAIPLGSLVNVTTYSNGFGFHDERSTHVVTVESNNDRLVFDAVLNKVLAGRP
jgi:hypothetical protein